jgi:aminoglycoside phosphotransferase (APT) family kinase protein
VEEFAALEPLAGGWSGETFLARGGEERSVVRLFAASHHAPAAAEIQAALLGLMRGLVPVPAVLEARPARDGMPPLLITEYVDGDRGDLVLPRLAADDLERIGVRLGRIAATLAGIPQARAGRFTDAALAVDPFGGDLVDWVQAHPLDDVDPAALAQTAARAQDLLDTVDRVALVHGDLNPKNVLLDPDGPQVRAVVDWEFAHAGHPFTDLGNLLRFDREPAYVAGVLGGWTQLRGGDPDGALELARAADLVALVDLAARRGAHPVADRAHTHLAAIAASEDWHATPRS